MQTDAALLANNSQHCWMLHVKSVCTPCCMLLRVVAQSLKLVKLFRHQLPSATVLDPFAQLFQHCWGHACSLRMVYKDLWVDPFHDALQVPTLLGVVASVCTPLPTRTQQLPTLLAQQCLELLRLFARSLIHLMI